jgi:hypothetical protein
VSVNEKKWLVMHMQLKLYELRGPPNPWLTRVAVWDNRDRDQVNTGVLMPLRVHMVLQHHPSSHS